MLLLWACAGSRVEVLVPEQEVSATSNPLSATFGLLWFHLTCCSSIASPGFLNLAAGKPSGWRRELLV